MDDFYRMLERIESCQNRSVLATIIDVKGSTYRKMGTSMLVVSNGANIGMLSGGCLETDLAARADQWFSLTADDFERLKSQTLIYDMRSEDENGWGRGAGCNGMMTVLMEPVTTTFRHQLIQLKHQMDRGLAAASLRHMDKNGYIKRAFVIEDGRMFGDVENFKPLTRDASFSDLSENQYIPGNIGTNVIRIVHHIRPKLLILGAGDDAIPLAELASKTGWTVTVADWRAALCNYNRFPMVETCRVGIPEDLLMTIPISNRDAVVVMTHDFQIDQRFLHSLLEKECLYIGVLGPLERTRRLLKVTIWPENLKAPVGLDIDAEGPEEIAVSIIAELIKTYRNTLKRSKATSG